MPLGLQNIKASSQDVVPDTELFASHLPTPSAEGAIIHFSMIPTGHLS